MPQSRAEIQKRYRERRKLLDGEKVLAAERQRQHKYYTPASEMTSSERKKRNKKINERVQKHRKSKRLNVQENVASDNELHESTSGYSSQGSSASQLVVRFPLRRNGPKKKLNNALKAANAKLRRVISENLKVKTKVKTLQRKLQRFSTSKVKQNDLTPRRKSAKFMTSTRIRNEKVKQQLLFGNVIIHQLKTDRGKCARKHGKGMYSSVAGEVIKKYRCIDKLASELKLNRNKLSTVIKNGVSITKLRRRRTSMKLQLSVTQFLEREDNCRIQPGKRDAAKVGDGKIQTRILTDYMANLHQKFQAEHPENKLSLATFCRMRPKHILLTSCLSRNVCLCTKHQNMTLKLQALRKCGIDVPQNPETFITSGNTDVEKNKLPETVPYSKWKRVTLENNKKPTRKRNRHSHGFR